MASEGVIGHVCFVHVCSSVSLLLIAELGAILAFSQLLEWGFEVVDTQNGGDVGGEVQLLRVLIWILAVGKTDVS